MADALRTARGPPEAWLSDWIEACAEEFVREFVWAGRVAAQGAG